MAVKSQYQVRKGGATTDAVAAPEPEIKQVEGELVYSVIVTQGRSVSLNGKSYVGGTPLDLTDKAEYDWLKKIGFIVDA